MDQIESGELTYDDLVKQVQAAIDRREGRAPPLKPKKVRVVGFEKDRACRYRNKRKTGAAII